MVLDLNKALFYFDANGAPRTAPLRYLTIVDGIVGGHRDGPSSPDPIPSGVVVAGRNPVAVDAVAATLMGFDPERIPVIRHAWRIESLPLILVPSAGVICRSNRDEWSRSLADLQQAPHLGFEPHFGWRGAIEREQPPATAPDA